MSREAGWLSRRIEGCHSTVIGKYVVEGHVPVGPIKRLLAEKPDITGDWLLPGDVLATGTPPGVGMGKNKYMAVGDILECGISHLGAQRHEIVG